MTADPRETSAPAPSGGKAASPQPSQLPRAATLDQRGGVASASFLGLLATQFCGAANDNAFRMLAIGLCTPLLGRQHASLVIAAGLACFTLPYILLAAPAGYLADKFSKRRVIVGCKLAEIVLMLAAVGTMAWVDSPTLHLAWTQGWKVDVHVPLQVIAVLALLFLMGSHSALFSPSKFGSIPELVRPERLSAANGVMGLVTLVATVGGTLVGNYLAYLTAPNLGRFAVNGPSAGAGLGLIALVLVGKAGLGTAASLLVRPLGSADPARRFPWNFARQTIGDLRALGSHKALLRVSLGIAYFWSVGALANQNILALAADSGLQQVEVNPLLAALVVGVGVGSVLAGVLSGGRVELGMLPLGAAGMAIGGMALFTVSPELATPEGAWTGAKVMACVWLAVLGLSAGLFNVPLESFLQHRSPRNIRGSILGASNFISFSGMLTMAIVFAVLRQPVVEEGWTESPWFSAREIFLLAGVFTVPIVVYIVLLIPDATLRFVVWLASKTFYRIRIHGLENLPEQGGALLVSNHVSWLDGILLLLTAPRPVRMIANSQFVTGRVIGWMARVMQVIPITLGSKGSVRRTLETAREALRRGELVCIFPEGGITRTGELQPFKRGLLALVQGTDAPIIPVFLDELWGSIFSFEGGRFFWKIPRRLPYPVSIHFGPPVTGAQDVGDVQRAVERLGTHAVEQRSTREVIPPKAFLRTCRARRKKLLLADSLGEQMTGGQVLLRTLILRRLLLREVLAPDEKYVGILIPPSAGSVIVNAAMPLVGRIGVNLNYTLSKAEIDHCIRECGIRHVLTTRKVIEKLTEKFHLRLDGVELVYLDDLRAKVRFSDKLAGLFAARCLPLGTLEKRLGIDRIQPDDVLTVIFTSGSTAMPKGVMLTHRNVGSNVVGIDGLIKLRENDVIAGTLPFFHSFGYTATVWLPLMLGTTGAYHVSPLDYQIVGKLCRHAKATILVSTPTFLRGYLKRCQPEDFVTLDVVVAGAERLPTALCDAFEKKFGVRPVEGYGTTELSPLVSCNIPPDRRAGDENRLREGSVGRTIPGVQAKIVDLESGADLPPDHEGMLLVHGPNVMKGYLNHPEKTAEVIRHGWYVTGDIARMDADGFIFITGRLSRFSKIGGEMVPHLKVEEEIQRILGKDDELRAAVTAVPDEAKGERLIVLHVPLDLEPEQIRKELLAAGLPKLFVPSRDSFCQVDEIPVLGSGKLDLKAVKRLALQKFGMQREKQ